MSSPTEQQITREYADQIMKGAHTNMSHDKFVGRTWFVWDFNRFCHPIILPTENKAEVRELMKRHVPNAMAIGTVGEVWLVCVSKHEDLNTVMPTEDPRRTEAIMVNVESRAGTWVIISKFTRSANGDPSEVGALEAEWSPVGEGGLGGTLGNLFSDSPPSA